MSTGELFRPPAPYPVGDARTFLKIFLDREFNLLTALSRSAYTAMMGRQTFFGRRLYLVNDPVTVREILVDKADRYPKAAPFVDALSPLVGDGIFVSNGETWRRQRATLRPALSQMSLRTSYGHMRDAVASCAERIGFAADRGEPVALDAELSHVTADVIFRTIFSEPIDSAEARRVFEAFGTVQTLSDQLSVRRLLYSLVHRGPSRPTEFAAACRRIRETIGRMVDRRLGAGTGAGRRAGGNIADELAAAADPETGHRFNREDLVDQIAVFFLAGHETTASLLTWTFVILAGAPGVTDRVRAEAEALGPNAPIEAVQGGPPYLRAVLREVLRLYPPVGFLMRTPLAPDDVRGYRLRPGDILVISPWVMGRHRQLWRDPNRFDPERFAPDRAHAIVQDSFIPFGLGSRVCPGAAFATVEATLILARLLAEFEIEIIQPGAVRPIARLTVRPSGPVICRVRRRG